MANWSAAVGIVGAFVTPALVQTDTPSLPGLFGYLLFVTATALAVVRYTAWIWLGWATTIAGAVWVLLAIAAGADADHLGAGAVRAGCRRAQSRRCCRARRWTTRSADAWPGCRARRWARPGCCWRSTDQGWATRIGVLLFVPLTIGRAATRGSTAPAAVPRRRCCSCCCWPAWSVEMHDWPDIAIPPDAWTPAVVQALLATAALIAGCFAASGLWFERRAA